MLHNMYSLPLNVNQFIQSKYSNEEILEKPELLDEVISGLEDKFDMANFLRLFKTNADFVNFHIEKYLKAKVHLSFYCNFISVENFRKYKDSLDWKTISVYLKWSDNYSCRFFEEFKEYIDFNLLIANTPFSNSNFVELFSDRISLRTMLLLLGDGDIDYDFFSKEIKKKHSISDELIKEISEVVCLRSNNQ